MFVCDLCSGNEELTLIHFKYFTTLSPLAFGIKPVCFPHSFPSRAFSDSRNDRMTLIHLALDAYELNAWQYEVGCDDVRAEQSHALGCHLGTQLSLLYINNNACTRRDSLIALLRSTHSNSSNMLEFTFSNMPTELVEYIAGCLDDQDLLAFRFSCRMIDAQTVRIVGERFFSTLQTSIMGPDIQKLKQLSCERFAKYVKTIRIQNNSEKMKKALRAYSDETQDGQRGQQEYEKRTLSPHIWPLDAVGDIDIDKTGVSILQHILGTCQLRPDELSIWDFNDIGEDECLMHERCTTLARHIFLGSKLAITYLQIGRSRGGYRPTAVARLIPEHQGRDLGLIMLKKARLRLGCDDSSTYWFHHLLLHAQAVEELQLRTMCTMAACRIYETNAALRSRKPCFQLKALYISRMFLAGIPIFNLLSNSKNTLSSLVFSDVKLHPDSKISNWTQLLENIAKEHPNLTHWRMILRLSQPGVIDRIFFPGFGKDCLEEADRGGLKIVHDGKEGGAAFIRYNGPGAARALCTMASYARSR